MTNSLTYSLLFLALLTSCTGCKKDTEPAAPATNCLIATQITKQLVSPSQTSTLDPETVTINGESFKVTTIKKSAYTYDKQGRILTEYNQYAGNEVREATGKADSVFYQYSPTAVSIRTIIFDDNGKRERVQVVAIDSQGFAEKQPTTNLATYDKDGYLTTLRDEYGRNIAKIDNGNVLELTFGDSALGSVYVTKSEYDSSKPGLPSVRAFYGKPSRNLLIRSVIDKSLGYSVFPGVYISIYTYTFDKAGRPTRQIKQGKESEPGFIYGANTVKTIDFTYVCP